MLTDLVESIRKTEEKMKPMLRETKENAQGTNSDGKENGTQINGVDQKEEISIRPEQDEETRIQTYEERLRKLQDSFKHSNIQIIGVPEEKEQQQEMENLFEQIMKENFPNLAKELSGSPGSSESPREAGPKEAHTKAHHNYITQHQS